MRKLFGLYFILGLSSLAHGAINCPTDTSDKYNSVVKIIRKEVDNEGHCTGAIVNRCYVLTASHCLLTNSKDRSTLGSPSEFSVRSGLHSETDLGTVVAVKKFPGFVSFQEKTKYNDVGVLKLAKCVDQSMEIDFSRVKSGQKVTVGGYGMHSIGQVKPESVRKIGPNKIHHFDENEICLGPVRVEKDGRTIKKDSSCLPTTQDSGSPLIINGKVRGVFSATTATWNSDGSTQVNKSCYINLKNPVIRNFLEEIFSEDAVQAGKKPEAAQGAR